MPHHIFNALLFVSLTFHCNFSTIKAVGKLNKYSPLLKASTADGTQTKTAPTAAAFDSIEINVHEEFLDPQVAFDKLVVGAQPLYILPRFRDKNGHNQNKDAMRQFKLVHIENRTDHPDTGNQTRQSFREIARIKADSIRELEKVLLHQRQLLRELESTTSSTKTNTTSWSPEDPEFAKLVKGVERHLNTTLTGTGPLIHEPVDMMETFEEEDAGDDKPGDMHLVDEQEIKSRIRSDPYMRRIFNNYRKRSEYNKMLQAKNL